MHTFKATVSLIVSGELWSCPRGHIKKYLRDKHWNVCFSNIVWKKTNLNDMWNTDHGKKKHPSFLYHLEVFYRVIYHWRRRWKKKKGREGSGLRGEGGASYKLKITFIEKTKTYNLIKTSHIKSCSFGPSPLSRLLSHFHVSNISSKLHCCLSLKD